ncbi:integrator complex subunit 9-like [Patiria miniata]|uniref:Beta-Casp domain-containing protein n=1 Tax=Patiria miniata TaxID=46514 RepID=A0A913ZKS7_PATMI|nr:integrator complex subunit 9-like [Patiria miniata]
MKLYCLSDHPNAPCLLLTFKSTTILLDCGLDLTSLQHFLPLTLVPSARLNSLPPWTVTGDISTQLKDDLKKELKECSGRVFVDSSPEVCLPELGIVDFSTVDAILVSNYHCMLALPFITEYTGFKGRVYCTDPTQQTGRQLMEEFVEYMERVPRAKTAVNWKKPSVLKMLPAPLRDIAWATSLRRCYTTHDINSCMSKVRVTAFSEKLNLFGSLMVSPHSSGYCLGSCNWVIKSDYEKVCYVSSSSFLTTHSIPILQEPLKNSDLLLLTGITQTPAHNPDSMLGEFCSNLTVTIKNGGNVLVPCYPSGIIYDLFECLSGYMDSVGLTQVPMFFVSPVADSSLAYSQIFSEWLCAQKQSKVFLPEPPFPHAELIKSGRLKHFSTIHGDFSSHFKTPCVVFTGHPSLRLGDAVHFMELWGKSSSNTVIFIEPNFSYLDALAPYQPLAMKACYCPIDTAISFPQATKMIKELKPLHVVLPECYLTPPTSQPLRTDLVVEAEVAPTPYKRGSVLHLPIKRRLERIEITPELAGSLAPIEVKPGVFVSTVTGTITARDNKYILQEAPKQALPSTPSSQPIRKRKREDDGGVSETAHPKQYVYGNLEVEELVQALAKNGITDVKVEDTASGHIIHLQTEDTIIQLEEGSTHIFCEGNEPLRRKLRDTLIACLPSF